MQKISYIGDGSTTEFTFNFPYYENSNIIVTKNNTTATGYTVVGIQAELNADIPYVGGKIVFEIAPTVLDTITISHSLPLTRIVDYQPTVKIENSALNQDMNYMMEVLKDLNDKFDNLSEKYTEIADKESTEILLNRIDEISNDISDVNQTIIDFNTEIENGRIMSKDDFFTYSTNCLTNIPQDIKLELNNGTLTLKSGSKVYVPNGSNVFNIRNISSDISVSDTGLTTNTYMLFINKNAELEFITDATSGATAPANGVFYNTSINKIDMYINSVAQDKQYSLPIGIISVTNGVFTSINQIFNGFGYIGSTIFSLPGVSGLIPNGRNNDGTLNNIVLTNNSVKKYDVSGTYEFSLTLAINGIGTYFYAYDADKNYVYRTDTGAFYYDRIIVGKVSIISGNVKSLTIKNPLHITDLCDITE